MKNLEFYDRIDGITAHRILRVEGELIFLIDFMYINLLEKDVDHITLEDAQKIIDLNINESVYIGIVEITRLT